MIEGKITIPEKFLLVCMNFVMFLAYGWCMSQGFSLLIVFTFFILGSVTSAWMWMGLFIGSKYDD